MRETVATTSPTQADCIGGGYAYVGHGEDCVMVAFSPEVGWWRNSVWFTPAEGRRLAERLLEQVEHAEAFGSKELRQ